MCTISHIINPYISSLFTSHYRPWASFDYYLSRPSGPRGPELPTSSLSLSLSLSLPLCSSLPASISITSRPPFPVPPRLSSILTALNHSSALTSYLLSIVDILLLTKSPPSPRIGLPPTTSRRNQTGPPPLLDTPISDSHCPECFCPARQTAPQLFLSVCSPPLGPHFF
ncbi:hypothetical protein LX32DRAFT_100033 [Colletotrichum zoysiae]|uniref:Uncharacterized protein n=1 Tax=Colletotrichum zoysiae TaxID=1216348 RepID=A0AAD9HAL4_9PEZI|nr:hypothetical protein LX32DRAFT_100033 [Colletotrichum zoysiae]